MSDTPRPTVRIETNHGTLAIELWPDHAPNHVANFLQLAQAGHYDGLMFHRVIPGFMIQGGCPEGTGTGGPGYQIPAEFNDQPFVTGVLGMARTASPDTAGCQFFICVADAAHLTGNYTAFGALTEGQEVADAIADLPRDGSDRPNDSVVMTSVICELPEGYELPAVRKV